MTAVVEETPRARGRTLQALAEEVDRIQKASADYIADTRQMGFHCTEDGECMLAIDSAEEDGGLGEFGIRPVAHEQIALYTGIPKVFYDRLRFGREAKSGRGAREALPELLAHNVETIFRAQPAKRMVRTLDGKARAFLSNRYRRLDNYHLLEVAVLPTVAEMPGAIVDGEVTERRLYLNVRLPKVEAEIKVGDPVQAGFLVTNSEVGLGRLGVQLRVYTLACKNGMVVPDFALTKYHVGKQIAGDGDEAYQFFADETLAADDHAYFLKVRDMVRAIADEAKFKQICIQLRELTETKPMENPVEAVKRLAKPLEITEKEQTGLLTHLVTGGDLTAYGAMNAVTRLAQDAGDYDRRYELESAGGKVLALTEQEWAAIAAA